MKLWSTILAGGLLACSSGCGAEAQKRPLDEASFNAAKQKCGANKAAYFSGGVGFALEPGRSEPSDDEKKQLECLQRELAGFRFHLIIETPPA